MVGQSKPCTAIKTQLKLKKKNLFRSRAIAYQARQEQEALWIESWGKVPMAWQRIFHYFTWCWLISLLGKALLAIDIYIKKRMHLRKKSSVEKWETTRNVGVPWFSQWQRTIDEKSNHLRCNKDVILIIRVSVKFSWFWKIGPVRKGLDNLGKLGQFFTRIFDILFPQTKKTPCFANDRKVKKVGLLKYAEFVTAGESWETRCSQMGSMLIFLFRITLTVQKHLQIKHKIPETGREISDKRHCRGFLTEKAAFFQTSEPLASWWNIIGKILFFARPFLTKKLSSQSTHTWHWSSFSAKKNRSNFQKVPPAPWGSWTWHFQDIFKNPKKKLSRTSTKETHPKCFLLSQNQKRHLTHERHSLNLV